MKDKDKKEDILRVTRANLEAFVVGGVILGGGGGGWVEEGRKLGLIALERGFSSVLPLSLLPEEALLVTVSAVGSPSTGKNLLRPEDFIRAVELLIEKTGLQAGGLISSEVGALGVVNGWVQSVALGIPAIDAPANGRAHPLGLMGSMVLHRKRGYVSYQAAVGRKRKTGKADEIFISGPLEDVARKVLAKASGWGGMVAVARNPVAASFVSKNGAPGALRMAFELGRRFLNEGHRERRARTVVRFFGQGRAIRGEVKRKTLRVEEGLDIGSAVFVSGKNRLTLTFWNEYMTLEEGNKILAMFPDLLMTFDGSTAQPLVSAELESGREIELIVVPRRCLLLGAGVKDPRLLSRVQKVVAAIARREGKG